MANRCTRTWPCKTLFDTEATRVTILQKLDELGFGYPTGRCLHFYYADHGSMVDDQFFFIPTENLRLYDRAA